jgi:hypothetical protein
MQWFAIALIFGGIFGVAAASRAQGSARWELMAAGVMAVFAGILVLVVIQNAGQ